MGCFYLVSDYNRRVNNTQFKFIMKTVIAPTFDVIKTQRLIDRILEVPNFENVAYVCKDFQDFCFEVAEWGVDHAAGVDFDDPTLDIAMLNEAIAGHGYAPEDCL